MSLKEEGKVHTQKKEKNKKIVLLIDAENIHSIFAAQIMQYIDKLGNIVVKRIYGDWQSSCIKNWKKPALFYSITPCQQFSITHPHSKTKNTTDIALIIDAMTLLYEKDIDIFCIVSSDSDFYTLVRTLREKNKQVIGFGSTQVNENYKNAFNEFIILQDKKVTQANRQQSPKSVPQVEEKIKKNKDMQKSSKQQKNASKTGIKERNKQKKDSFLKEDAILQAKIKVYLLSLLDNKTQKDNSCNGQFLFDKLREHNIYKYGIAIDSYKLFLQYLQTILSDKKYTLQIKNAHGLIYKIENNI